jgi:hypothetical protein
LICTFWQCGLYSANGDVGVDAALMTGPEKLTSENKLIMQYLLHVAALSCHVAVVFTNSFGTTNPSYKLRGRRKEVLIYRWHGSLVEMFDFQK